MTRKATYSEDLKDGLCAVTLRQFDGGSLVLQDRAGKAVATLTFGSPAFEAPNKGIATAYPLQRERNAVGGTVARASWQDVLGQTKLTCSVTKKGGKGAIELDEVAILPGQTVELEPLIYAVP